MTPIRGPRAKTGEKRTEKQALSILSGQRLSAARLLYGGEVNMSAVSTCCWGNTESRRHAAARLAFCPRRLLIKCVFEASALENMDRKPTTGFRAAVVLCGGRYRIGRRRRPILLPVKELEGYRVTMEETIINKITAVK